MSRQQRIYYILENIEESGTISITDIVADLGVSEATARRDLDHLAANNLIERRRGGAGRRSVAYSLALRGETQQHRRSKELIAEHALSTLEPGQSVGLSGGTTTYAIADALGNREDLHSGLTVVTNSVEISSRLAVHPEISILVTGGRLNSKSYELVGTFAELIMKHLWLDRSFIGVNSFSADVGAGTVNENEASVNRLMAQRSDVAAVVADSSKYGRRSFGVVGDADTFHSLITDDRLPDEARAALEGAGYTVHTVSEETET
ncbi:DeoR/GlpR transcriptional regulator [Nocardiopsis sp. HNM0947]|uniref:DeoR/GlpR transcriptional regulator n=1 Tax=Nocardiopsis coralli TaxID=2772213 RepID=A0ABR9P9Y4_9ACTN|nr:DeoR/GlpR family DNA-binding transcription regulator [Nocardiopsis coralli]MBE3000654.1 DeoR/GlpR transcriptional regulator [Nocardiopsis coralli]